jgi:serine/threonine protein kinase
MQGAPPSPPETGACLDDSTAAALVHGGLSGHEAAAALVHLDACETCHELVALVARAERPSESAPLRRGDAVGRYLILEVLGAGAMGVVYSAFDPDLGRRVALKVLRAGAARAAGIAETALLREAQAMARLSHAHVVVVHDVGTHGGQVFIAMELVEGGSLREWLAKAPGWRATARLFLQAAEGLEAAHRAGVIHRDFKPDNVLVTPEGVAKVGDFGLARVRESLEPTAAPPALPTSRAESLFRTGVVIGTPAYMSPEQRAGRPADARSDQYAFAVAFQEALTGARPGERPAHPRRVPKSLLSLLARALSPEPERRFDDMEHLALRLRRALAGRRRTILALAAGAVLSVLTVLLWVTGTGEPCTGATAAWGTTWGDGVRAAVREAFLANGKTAAAPLAWVERSLDAYRDEWLAMYGDACRATRVRAEQSEALLDLRMRCLARLRDEIAALVEFFRKADARLIAHSSSALAALPPLTDCANAEALRAPLPLPTDAAARAPVEGIERTLARVNALLWTGQHEPGLRLARAAAEQARTAGYLPTLARALQLQGELERNRALPSAERTTHEAARTALQANDLTTAGRAWSELVHIGYAGHRREEADVWAGYAEVAFRLVGDHQRRAAGDLARAMALVESNELDAAVDIANRWRRDAEGAYGVDHPNHYLVEWVLGAVAFEKGRYEVVAEIFHRISAAQAPLNPRRASIARKKEAEALVRIPARREEGIALFRAVLGEMGDNSDHTWSRTRLADGLRRAGRAREALVEHRRALTGAERAFGSDSPAAALALTGIGIDLLDLGRPGEAQGPLERALVIRVRLRTPIPLAEARWALARALRAQRSAPARVQKLASLAREGLLPRARRYGSWYAEMVREIDSSSVPAP